MSLLKIAELQGQLARRDARITELEAEVSKYRDLHARTAMVVRLQHVRDATLNQEPRTFPDGTFTFDPNDFLYQKGLHDGRMEAQYQEPEAFRHSFDGFGWLYCDNGSGSSWKEMVYPDKEFLFTRKMPTIERLEADDTEGGAL
ncbi:hypothetical protein UFOVP241_22 [uncultured Caudovirales phage]|uniref:Uncharacterized protein n=1 Tax=uncultured Caudovirales phage TaxID=2100421 RepID=A0A6J7WSG9_9CAUD|nr:hypothetical protein UFOVP241_22 [uncultured Caudovirales phage]